MGWCPGPGECSPGLLLLKRLRNICPEAPSVRGHSRFRERAVKISPSKASAPSTPDSKNPAIQRATAKNIITYRFIIIPPLITQRKETSSKIIPFTAYELFQDTPCYAKMRFEQYKEVQKILQSFSLSDFGKEKPFLLEGTSLRIKRFLPGSPLLNGDGKDKPPLERARFRRMRMIRIGLWRLRIRTRMVRIGLWRLRIRTRMVRIGLWRLRIRTRMVGMVHLLGHFRNSEQPASCILLRRLRIGSAYSHKKHSRNEKNHAKSYQSTWSHCFSLPSLEYGNFVVITKILRGSLPEKRTPVFLTVFTNFSENPK